MTSQFWEVFDEKILFGVSRYPCQKSPTVGILLLAGFSQPMCDIDYYMSRLAKALFSEGYYTLQMDIRGHGESSDSLQNITLNTIREDIVSSIHILEKHFGRNIICIGRGLTATILADVLNDYDILGVCGINPYALAPDFVKKLWSNISKKDYEIQDLFCGKKYITMSDFDQEKAVFFNSLGGEVGNLHGQMLNGRFLLELCAYDPYKALSQNPGKNIWIIQTQNNELLVEERKFDCYNKYIMEINDKYMFSRNPMWQYNSFKYIEEWILTILKREKCEEK